MLRHTMKRSCLSIIFILIILAAAEGNTVGHCDPEKLVSKRNNNSNNSSTNKSINRSVKHSSLEKVGKGLFQENQCLECHSLSGRGCLEGVPLDGIGDRRTVDFLRAQLKDPERHFLSLYHEDAASMPSQNLSNPEINALVAYLQTLHLKKKDSDRSATNFPTKRK